LVNNSLSKYCDIDHIHFLTQVIGQGAI